MKPLKSKVSITLDEDVIKKIKELAEEDDRSFSQYINMVLKTYLCTTESIYIKITILSSCIIQLCFCYKQAGNGDVSSFPACL